MTPISYYNIKQTESRSGRSVDNLLFCWVLLLTVMTHFFFILNNNYYNNSVGCVRWWHQWVASGCHDDEDSGPVKKHGLSEIRAWIIDYINCFKLGVIIHGGPGMGSVYERQRYIVISSLSTYLLSTYLEWSLKPCRFRPDVAHIGRSLAHFWYIRVC